MKDAAQRALSGSQETEWAECENCGVGDFPVGIVCPVCGVVIR
jgi:uncharacterized OB-fold protein